MRLGVARSSIFLWFAVIWAQVNGQFDLNPENPTLNYQLLDSVTFSTEAISISMGTPGTSGFIWGRNKLQMPLELDLELEFSIAGPESSTLTNGFALWFTTESFPNLDGNSNLFGYRNRFEGMSVFFSNFDRNEILRPSISAAFNDGLKSWDMDTETPSNDGIYFGTRNLGEPTFFRISFTPDQILGLVRSKSSTTWTQTFKLPIGGFRLKSDNVYIGLSSSTKLSSSTDGSDRGDVISFKKMSVNGKLVKQMQPQAIQQTSNNEPQEKVEEKIKEIQDTGCGDTRPIELTNEDRFLIADLEARVSKLQNQLERFSVSVGEIQQEIKWQKSVLQNVEANTNTVESTLSTIQKTIQNIVRKVDKNKDSSEIRILQQSVEQGLATIKDRSSFSWWILGSLFCIFLISVFLIWRKISSLEKSHVY